MISIYTMRTLYSLENKFQWSATVNMRIDYFAPVVGPSFRLIGELIKEGRSTCLISTIFCDSDDKKLVYALTTLRKSD
jgi:acyl-coenzyme A thioesterase PaaI-like protein